MERKWWGWGTTGKEFPFPVDARDMLFDALHIRDRRPSPPPALPGVPAAIPLTPPCRSSVNQLDRIHHSAGKSTPDLLRVRHGRLAAVPDSVLFPESSDEVASVLQWARREKVAVVPFGGGTSVVGGVHPGRGNQGSVVSLDLGRLKAIQDLDAESGLARAEAGILGPDLEAGLGAEGWSLGHFPQSFEFSTLGGWVATRSAGQNSTLYGKIEQMVRGLRMVTPSGEMVQRVLPANATGPELREVMVGSEGTLGVIVDATVLIHRRPARTRYASFLLKTFAEGTRACREIVQEGLRPAVLRLSDEQETAFQLRLSGADRSWGARFLRFTGKGAHLNGVHLMLGFEGGEEWTGTELSLATRVVKRLGGVSLGSRPGEKWEQERFALPYLRDTLLDLGILVDTLETAASWSRLPRLYEAVRSAIGTPVLLAHVSHAYPDGASLYFTFLSDAPDPDQALEDWARIKKAAGDAIIASGGTISHHHAVGMDHRPWITGERGEGQMNVLRALKSSMDPDGILNPGKLIP